jgi:alkanesulfonate monooxygenase SsuD/methylene tetrahydromethanopterin reductase-like flavin-dependent oxidoreductase (luciferase family)
MAPTVLERIRRRADGWLARAAGSTNGVIGDWAQIQRRLAELGRPPGSVTFGHLNFMHVGSTDARRWRCACSARCSSGSWARAASWSILQTCYLLGTPRQIGGRLAELAQAGLEYLVLSPLDYDLDQLHLWESEVLRQFRSV